MKLKDILENIFGFLYTLSMGDYIFFMLAFILLLGVVYMIYLIKKEDEKVETYYKEENSDYLESIKEKIEKEYKPTTIKLTEYEEEQEKNAIISYDELVKNKDSYTISYDDEYVSNSEINVKKISSDNTGVKSDNNETLQVKLMNYDKEEAFLTALKQLQQNLSN
ncbi:MAG: hypothetical protein IJD92_03050 [Bacilli bacterium]|nr:hypothetical protein [Bacilli bacterium]